VILQKNQLLLRFLKLRVVVNGKVIYDVKKNSPVVIDIPTNPSRLVLTDGFHISPPIDLNIANRPATVYHVGCVIEDDLLLVGLLIMFIVYAMGATSDMFILQLISIAPVVYFLFLYYIKRREFIQLRPA
jgi:hypothetical protein